MTRYPLKLVLLVLIPALFSILLVACGGDDDDDTPSDGTPLAQARAATPAPSPTPDPRAGWPGELKIGLFGGDDAEETLRNAKPMEDLLESRLGIPVEIITGTSYGAVIEAMRAGRVDAMTVGPFAYILAVQEANAEALAVSISTTANPPVYNPDLLPYYISVIFTKKGSGITSLEDLKGKGFNFVDPASTSGHLAPKALLIREGLDPDDDLEAVFAGSHPTSALSVWNGKSPAGATNEGNLKRLHDSGQVQFCEYPDKQINKPRTKAEMKAYFDGCPDGTLVAIAQTDPIPNTPFAVRQELSETLKAEIKAALLSTKDNPEFIAQRKAWYVDPTADLKLESLDKFYNPLRELAKLLNLDLKELAEQG
ncbi:MAG TPA: phosphate/phosphite/phosphonate ABC transporter substrate-binding protein [Tepidiformaceae bacterium]|nr:phosphate/phosphite/phosphonate ABC transporter substrate-binding protein [Tepidiformaceae bacterium]